MGAVGIVSVGDFGLPSSMVVSERTNCPFWVVFWPLLEAYHDHRAETPGLNGFYIYTCVRMVRLILKIHGSGSRGVKTDSEDYFCAKRDLF